MAQLVFRKSGKQIKAAIQTRRMQLQARLDKRNSELENFMKDSKKVFSYLVRSSQLDYGGHATGYYLLVPEDEIGSKERQEVQQLCRRIFQTEQELHHL